MVFYSETAWFKADSTMNLDFDSFADCFQKRGLDLSIQIPENKL